MRCGAKVLSFRFAFCAPSLFPKPLLFSVIRLLIYEDNTMLRQSLELLFSAAAGIELVAVFGHCENAAKETAYHLPDVVLMDIDLPGGTNGIDGVRIVKEKRPQTLVLMHTVFEDSQKIFDSLAAGADGYLLKTTSPDALFGAIKDVTTGGTPISPGVARKVLEYFRDAGGGRRDDHVELSHKELEVLKMLTDGYTYKRIAFEGGNTINTTRTHIRNIYEKLHVNCGTEAVAKALRLRLLKRGDE